MRGVSETTCFLKVAVANLLVDSDEARMAIKGDGSSLTIALRGNYAQAAWANRSADIRLRVFGYSKATLIN